MNWYKNPIKVDDFDVMLLLKLNKVLPYLKNSKTVRIFAKGSHLNCEFRQHTRQREIILLPS